MAVRVPAEGRSYRETVRKREETKRVGEGKGVDVGGRRILKEKKH